MTEGGGGREGSPLVSAGTSARTRRRKGQTFVWRGFSQNLSSGSKKRPDLEERGGAQEGPGLQVWERGAVCAWRQRASSE